MTEGGRGIWTSQRQTDRPSQETVALGVACRARAKDVEYFQPSLAASLSWLRRGTRAFGSSAHTQTVAVDSKTGANRESLGDARGSASVVGAEAIADDAGFALVRYWPP